MTKTGAPKKLKLDEFELIKTYFAPLTTSEAGAFNLTDDAAVLSLKQGSEFVITTDTIVDGVHFLKNTPPQAIAAKLLRVNLSDLASMGATPQSYTLSLALTNEISTSWLTAFTSSLAKEQKKYGITLVGGDTVLTPGPLTLTLTAIGTVQKGKAVRRNSARVGDDIYVSGFIGDSALGLLAAKSKDLGISKSESSFLVDRYQYPRCRVELGLNLIEIINAAADVSDGLVADLRQICQHSGVSADISVSLVPVSSAAQSALNLDGRLFDLILAGGDDYELVFTAFPSVQDELIKISKKTGIKLTKIGEILPKTDDFVRILDCEGNLVFLKDSGFKHF